jgi:hypothetical protein
MTPINLEPTQDGFTDAGNRQIFRNKTGWMLLLRRKYNNYEIPTTIELT